MTAENWKIISSFLCNPTELRDRSSEGFPFHVLQDAINLSNGDKIKMLINLSGGN